MAWMLLHESYQPPPPPPAMVYFFLSQCPFCTENANFWLIWQILWCPFNRPKWWCPQNYKYKVCFKECTFAHKMVGFKTFRALGKCRKTGIYGACIRPQGRLQNLSHKKIVNDITLQNDLSFIEVWERVFMNIFTQSRIRSKCNFMKRDENELVTKYSPYCAKLSTNITLQHGIKYMGLILSIWSSGFVLGGFTMISWSRHCILLSIT